eukprot:992993-Prymnesium_polylepis.2
MSALRMLMRSEPPISRHPSASHTQDETHILRRPWHVSRRAGVTAVRRDPHLETHSTQDPLVHSKTPPS